MSYSSSNPLSGEAHTSEKRAFATSLTATGRKRHKASTFEHYLTAARWVPRTMDPFVPMSHILWAGLDYEARRQGDNTNVYTKGWNPDDAAYNLSLYHQLVEHSPSDPSLPELLDKLRDTDGETLERFISEMHEATIGARSDDCGSLKHEALQDYVPSDPSDPSCALIPPLPKQKLKDDRGFNHPMLAALLCPRRELELFEVDPDFIHRLRDGTFPVYADQWPAFLYDSSNDFEYDPDNLDHGLLRGYFLERVYKHIFTSRSSARAAPAIGNGGPKGCNVALHNMDSVTPRSIAYAAVIARFTICRLSEWARTDANFDFQKFYYDLVNLFETEDEDVKDEEWCADTLRWWNMHVFGTATGRVKTGATAENQAGVQSDVNSLQAQRAARRLARLTRLEKNQSSASLNGHTAPDQTSQTSAPSVGAAESPIYRSTTLPVSNTLTSSSTPSRQTTQARQIATPESATRPALAVSPTTNAIKAIPRPATRATARWKRA